MSEPITPGSLVRYKSSGHITSELGIVLRGPEPFGFVDRCLVRWNETDSFGPALGYTTNPCWINIDNLVTVDEEE